MIHYSTIQKGEFCVLHADAHQLVHHSIEELIALIPNSRERIKKYKDKNAALNFVMGRLLLLEALKANNLPPTLLASISYTQHGKPLLKGLHFSIGHANNQVVCAYTTQRPIGIDIDYLRQLEIRHFKWWFSDEEWHTIQQASSPPQQLLHLWVQKEAILKTYGATIAQAPQIKWLKDNKAQFNTLPPGQLYPILMEGYICFVFLPIGSGTEVFDGDETTR